MEFPIRKKQTTHTLTHALTRQCLLINIDPANAWPPTLQDQNNKSKFLIEHSSILFVAPNFIIFDRKSISIYTHQRTECIYSSSSFTWLSIYDVLNENYKWKWIEMKWKGKRKREYITINIILNFSNPPITCVSSEMTHKTVHTHITQPSSSAQLFRI